MTSDSGRFEPATSAASLSPDSPEYAVAIDAAQKAAAVVRRFYEAQTAATYTKQDGSPVTDADLAADRVIRDTISQAFPDDALLTEEGASDFGRLETRRCWVVDPIDGTAEFVAGSGQFDILIALTIDGAPVVAVSMHPVSGTMHSAIAGHGAWVTAGDERRPFHIAPAPDPPRLVSSKWYGARHHANLIHRVAHDLGARTPPVLDVGFTARSFDDRERTYDAFIGFWPESGNSKAHEWDLATADLIVTEAGGRYTDLWGRRHRYNKRETTIIGGILACSDPALHERLLAAFAPELPAQPSETPDR